jgi:prephenate dehydratase
VHSNQVNRQVTKSGLTLGALGGHQTFNGQAAALLMRSYPAFSAITYYPTSDAVMDAALRGEVTAACGQEQTSKDGFHRGMQARVSAPGSPLYVVAEVAQRYQCALLCKPGAALEQVRRVLGHTGSTTHSRAWLERNLPAANIETVGTSSIDAARAVLAGDGSIACVGSSDLARQFALAELVTDIDEGSVVNYWAVSLSPLFDPAPNRLVVTGRFQGEPELSQLVCALRDIGFDLHAIYPRATGSGLYEYDYVFRFWGDGTFDAIQSLLSRFPRLRLAGAWRSRDDSSKDRPIDDNHHTSTLK